MSKRIQRLNKIVKRFSVSLIIAIGLAGCQAMEQRSGLPTKEPLEPMTNAIQVHKVWSKQTNDGMGKTDANLSFVVDKDIIYSADSNGHLVAVNTKNGAIVKRFDLGRRVNSGLALSKRQAFLADTNGHVVAVNLDAGTINWEKELHSEVLALPVFSDGVLYIHGMNGTLQALNAKNGETIYQYASSVPSLMLRRAAEPVITEQFVFNGFSNGKLAAISKHSGTAIWEQIVGIPSGFSDLERMSDISATPLVSDGNIYTVSYRGSMMSLTMSGELNWEKPLSSFSGMVKKQDIIYVSDSEGALWALQAKTGETLWKQDILKGRYLTKPVLQDSFIVVADEDGLVHWFDAKTGLPKGRYQFDKHGVRATPQVHNHTLFILSQGGKMTALTIQKS